MSSPPQGSSECSLPTSTTMATTDYWCLVIDRKKDCIGDIFYVDLTPEDFVYDLKVKVKSKKSPGLDKVDADSLIVWRCKTLRIRERKDGRSLTWRMLQNHINEIDFADVENNYIPLASETMASLGLSKDETLIVQLGMCSSFHVQEPAFKSLFHFYNQVRALLKKKCG
jgi:hypothetical protein